MSWQGMVVGGIFDLFRHATGGSRTESVPAPSRVTSAAPSSSRQEVGGDTRALKERFEELALACAAMWSLLEEKTSLTQEDLFAKIREIDLKDGVADGKMTRTVKNCPACGRTMSARHKKCFYCGALELKETPFEGI